jgi:ATP-binding cassette, subfamily G (WHITE), member 2, SNQ2
MSEKPEQAAVGELADAGQPGNPAGRVDQNTSDAEKPPAKELAIGESTASSSTENIQDGRWGEEGEGVNVANAAKEYEELRTQLSRTSSGGRPQSRQSRQSRKASLWRSITGRSRSSRGTRDADTDVEDQDSETEEEPQAEFPLEEFIRDGHFGKRKDGEATKKVGLIFKNLTVKGVGAQATYVRTLPEAILGTFGPDLYHLLTRFFPALHFGSGPPTRDLIRDFTGVVRDGSMMLVLGRPGSGCSTFLKVAANQRDAFAGVTGDVSYGGVPAEEVAKNYRGEVNYNPEDDVHMPALTVWQTLKFALLNKTQKREKGEIDIIIGGLMKMFGISHTANTLVGNEYVRGVSGGERKRVSIAEVLATKSSVVCWDNSTRGLDASTALDYAKSLRIMTDISHRTTLVTLYQAGEQIYEQMDTVLVIEEGRMLYQGPANKAKQYFVDLGFECPDRQTTADFLTSLCDPHERIFRPGMESKTPKTAVELEKAFRDSEQHKLLLAEVDTYEKEIHESEYKDAQEFKKTVLESKSKTALKRSPYTVSFVRQVLACTRREFWLVWGDMTTVYTKIFIIVSMGLIVGSLFYGQTLGTSGAFSRGGSLFFSILFLGWLQLTELMKAVTGRDIVARHKEYAFYRPSAVVIARVLADFPLLLFQVAIFGVLMYFMTNLDVEAGKFFIYLLFVYTTTICLTALYRMFGSLSPTINDAVRFSGIALNLLIIYTGYVIPKPQLVSKYIWFGWLYYVNPIAYSFEAVLSNEFAGRDMACDPIYLVPQGPGYTDLQYQGCAFAGGTPGSNSIEGSAYIETQYNYTRSHLWRNFGALIAWTVLYILVTAVASEVFSFAGGGGGAMVFKKTKKAKKQVQAAVPDEENAGEAGQKTQTDLTRAATQAGEEALKHMVTSDSIFTFKNVEYTVPTPAGPKKLLNNIQGYAKPGVLVALMGASGAGKTTLLNTLAQRQKFGVVGGEMLVNGRELGQEFQRGSEYIQTYLPYLLLMPCSWFL